MTHSRLNELMHAVLDGEATAAEARELDAVLARDAKAKDEFDELRSLFDGLAAVPQRFPPEGLVAAVTARLGELPAARTDADQLFAPSGVFGASSKDVRGGTPGNKAAVDRVFPLWAFFRGDTMSESTSGFSGKRKLLIGGGFAVAAVAVAVSTGLFPPSTDTAGTIVPADRYRAPQITAGDVKLGDSIGSRNRRRTARPAAAAAGNLPSGALPSAQRRRAATCRRRTPSGARPERQRCRAATLPSGERSAERQLCRAARRRYPERQLCRAATRRAALGRAATCRAANTPSGSSAERQPADAAHAERHSAERRLCRTAATSAERRICRAATLPSGTSAERRSAERRICRAATLPNGGAWPERRRCQRRTPSGASAERHICRTAARWRRTAAPAERQLCPTLSVPSASTSKRDRRRSPIAAITEPPATSRRFHFVDVAPYSSPAQSALGGSLMRRSLVCALVAWMPFAAIAAENPARHFVARRPRTSSSIYYDSLGYLVAARSAHLHERARVAAPDVRMDAIRADERAAAGPRRLRQRRRVRRAAQRADLRRRAAVARVRDVSSQRAHVLADEPRARPRRAGDVATDEDRRWRQFFLGKIVPQPAVPETLLYTLSDRAALHEPRWYPEGSAVFVETWMGGGLGRAQGGYDEMVFRAMVRDDAHFYDPLGLVSRGVQIDFQNGVNAYLYGTRFFTWLAYAYSPGEGRSQWIRRDEGSARYYSDQFEQVFGVPLEQAWNDWIAFEQQFQQTNLAEVRKFPDHAVQDTGRAAPSGRSRARTTTRRRATLYGAFRYPGTVEYVGALNTRDGSDAAARRHQARDALSRRVVRLRRRQRHSRSTRTTTCRIAT